MTGKKLTRRKNLFSRITALMTALILTLFIVPNGTLDVSAVSAHVTLENVSLTVNGESVTNQVLHNNDNVSFSFDWKIDKGIETNEPFDNPIVIQFDFNGMELNYMSGPLISNTETLGTYSITNGNTVTFTLDEDLLQNSNISGECNFGGKVKFNNDDIKDGNKVNIKAVFDSSTLINETVTVEPEGALSLTKSADGNVYGDGTNFYQNYKVTIKADGTAESKLNQIIDTPKDSNLSSFDSAYRINVTTSGNVTGVTSGTYDSFDQIANATMPVGSEIVLEYRMIVDDSIFSSNEPWNYGNNANIKYNDAYQKSASATPKPVWSELSKTGSGPDANGIITWTVKIKHGSFNGNIDHDKTILTSMSDTLTGNHDFVDSIYKADDFDFLSHFLANATFGATWDPVYTYTYKTKIDEENTTADREYVNTMTVTLDGVQRDIVGSVKVDGTNPITKAATATRLNADNEMEWKVTYTIPTGTTALKITDIPTATSGKSHSIVANSFVVTVGGSSTTAYSVSGNDITFDSSVLTANEGKDIVITYNTKASGDLTTEGTFTNVAKAVYTQNSEVIERESPAATYEIDTINAVTKSQSSNYSDTYNKLAWEIKIDLDEIRKAGHTLSAGDTIVLEDELERTYSPDPSAPLPTFTEIYYGETNSNDPNLTNVCLANINFDSVTNKFTFIITNEMINDLKWFTFRYRMDFADVNQIIGSNYANTVTATYNPNGGAAVPAGSSTGTTYANPNTGTILYKYNGYQSGYVAPYTVNINESLLDLSNTDTVTLTDKMGELLYLIPSTLTVKDGKTGAELADTEWSYRYSNSTNELVMTLPDERFLIVSYSAGLDVDMDNAANVDKSKLTNNVTLDYSSGDDFTLSNTWYAMLSSGNATIKYDYGHIFINKSDNLNNNKLLDGAEFRLIPGYFNTSGVFTPYPNQTLHKIITDTVNCTTGDNKIENLQLEGILYQMVETKAPTGYKADPKPKYIIIKNPGEENTSFEDKSGIQYKPNDVTIEYYVAGSTVMIENEVGNETTSSIEFRKYIKDTTTPLAGATLTLYNSKNTVVDTWTTTDATHTVEGLAAGTYKLVETTAPTGYDIAAPITIEIDSNGTITSTPASALSNGNLITMYDNETITQTYTVQFQKYIKDIDTGSYTDEVLIGAQLSLTDKATGTIIKEWKSAASPYEVSGLKAGTYVLSETNPPTGYKTADPIEFVIDANGKVTIGNDEIADKIIKMYDEEELYSIKFRKTDGYDANLAGASLKLVDSDGNDVQAWTSTADIKEISNLKAGEYTLVEVAPPAGYNPAADITFEIERGGDIYIGSEEVTNKTIVMVDEVLEFDVDFKKIASDTNSLLSGAELELYKGTDLIESWTTTGAVKTISLEAGTTYTLHEVTAPTDYNVANDITFTVGTDGTVKINNVTTVDEIEMVDAKIVVAPDTYDVKFKKIASDTNTFLEGATLEIYKGNDRVTYWTTGTEVKVIALEAGNYTLKEAAAPTGYDIAAEINFTVADNGTVTVNNSTVDTVEMIDAKIQTPQTFEVKFSKVDFDTNEKLSGAVLKLSDNSGNVVHQWTTDGTVTTVTGLEASEYTLTEVTAPSGYMLADSITFTITDAGIVDVATDGIVIMKDKKKSTEQEPENPGDDAPDTDTPGTDTPGTDTPGTDTPGTDTPGTDTPGTDTPNQNPGTTLPGSGSSNNNHGTVAPKPDNPNSNSGTTSQTPDNDDNSETIYPEDVSSGSGIFDESDSLIGGTKPVIVILPVVGLALTALCIIKKKSRKN